MENSFSSIINSSNSILILLPTKPYLDQVAASLALYLSLKEKKNVSISCPSPMMVEFNRLIGVDKISPELGNKNLTLRFINYKATNIERVSYDIENGQFRLTVIPKPGFSSPRKDHVDLSYSGAAVDTVILIGGGNISHFPAISEKKFLNAKLIHIGTKNIEFSELISLARPSSSTSEITASLLEEEGFYIDGDIATNLLIGIEEASENFKNVNVTAETFQTIANLMKLGGIRISKEKPVRGSYPPGSVPGEILEMENKEEPPHPAALKSEEKKKEPPKDWLEPKVYKGTTLS